MQEPKTKIQDIKGSKYTSIPSMFVKLLDIEKGDTLSWSIDMNTGILNVKLKKE